MQKNKIGFSINTPYKPKQTKSTRYRFEFVMDTISDAKLIEKLESYSNRSDYIRRLIQEDIERGTK